MKVTQQIAKHIREVHFGGNWTDVNLKDTLADVSWQQATTKVQSFHTIASLVYHMHYYVVAIVRVLKGGTLEAHDANSFDGPPIQSQQDWEQLVSSIWTDAEELASLVEALPEAILEETFVAERYGNYYKNLQGVTEHIHYHLGQVVWLKKLLPGK